MCSYSLMILYNNFFFSFISNCCAMCKVMGALALVFASMLFYLSCCCNITEWPLSHNYAWACTNTNTHTHAVELAYDAFEDVRMCVSVFVGEFPFTFAQTSWMQLNVFFLLARVCCVCKWCRLLWNGLLPRCISNRIHAEEKKKTTIGSSWNAEQKQSLSAENACTSFRLL